MNKSPLGGFGVGAVLFSEGSGKYWINMTTGTHFVELYASYIATDPRLLTIAHIVYRTLK